MQVTLYYGEEDQYLLKLVDHQAERTRRSRSAVIMAILEEHFERNHRLGEILMDMGLATPQEVDRALNKQRDGWKQPIGEILAQEGVLSDRAVHRALLVQNRVRKT